MQNTIATSVYSIVDGVDISYDGLDGTWKTSDGRTITGVGVVVVKNRVNGGLPEVDLCDENRIALTPEEQKEVGGAQTYLLPDVLKNVAGEVIPDKKLQYLIYKDIIDSRISKLNKNLKREKISQEDYDDNMSILLGVVNSNYEIGRDTINLVEKAREARKLFENRHFQMVVLREALKKDETLWEALLRLLNEEHLKKFKKGVILGKENGGVNVGGDFLYSRPGSKSAVLTWVINSEWIEDSEKSIQKKGECNYFCAKKLVDICSNDYNETRNHRYVSPEVAEIKIMEYMDSVPGADWSRYGALKFFRTLKNHMGWQFTIEKNSEGIYEAIYPKVEGAEGDKINPDVAYWSKAALNARGYNLDGTRIDGEEDKEGEEKEEEMMC